VPTTMLWRNWNPALLIAINEMAVNAVTELAARKIRKSAAFRGDLRRPSSGEMMSTPAMNTAPKMTAKKVVMIADVLKILLLSRGCDPDVLCRVEFRCEHPEDAAVACT